MVLLPDERGRMKLMRTLGKKQLSGLFFCHDCTMYRFWGGEKTFMKGRKHGFWNSEDDCISFSPPGTYGKEMSSETKAPPSETMRFLQAFIVIFTFVSWNTLLSTFKKLLIRGGQAVVKLTSPPTLLRLGGSFQGHPECVSVWTWSRNSQEGNKV